MSSVAFFMQLSKDLNKWNEYLQTWGFIPKEGTYMCPNCNGVLTLSRCPSSCDGFIWQCLNSKETPVLCDTTISYRKGTYFEDSNLSIAQIVAFAYMWTLEADVAVIESELDLTAELTVEWLVHCQEVLFVGFIKNSQPIGGKWKTVEINECHFDKQKYKRIHLQGEWIFAGLERETGKVFLVPVKNGNSSTLLKIIKKWILPGTTIISNCWRAYNCLSEKGYIQLGVDHSLSFKEPNIGVNITSTESIWNARKHFRSRWRNTFDTPADNLMKYMFNKHCKLARCEMTGAFFKLAVTLYSPLDSPTTTVSLDPEINSDSDTETTLEPQTNQQPTDL